MKQATYERYVLAKLSKFVQINTQALLDSILQRSLWKSKRAQNLSSGHIFYRFLKKKNLLQYYPNWPNFPRYLVKCVSCFMLRHFMMSWHLNTWKVKIWLSQEWKELSKGSKKHFSLFHKLSLFDTQNKLQNVADTTSLVLPKSQLLNVYCYQDLPNWFLYKPLFFYILQLVLTNSSCEVNIFYYIKHRYLLLGFLIFFFILWYSFNTLFTTTNSSWPI